MPRSPVSRRRIVLLVIALSLIGIALYPPATVGISVAAIGFVGVFFIIIPFTPARRASSRWFRFVAVSCGAAALLSLCGHALLLLQPHRFDRVRYFELQTAAQVLGGVWLGLFISLLFSAELWDPRKTHIDASLAKP